MKNLSKTEKCLRYSGIALCEAFTVFTIFMLLKNKEADRIFLACLTVLLILLPEAAELIFRCKISTPVYLFCLFYAIGAMLGHSWKFYYILPGWDKMLHIFGGVVFAIFGLFLFDILVEKCRKKTLTAAIFALCFSMAIAVLWEFVEFGADRFLGMDMQNDTIVTGFSSYYLGDGLGMLGELPVIGQVTVDGVPLPFEGYLDIGLFDSMYDMLLESLGALVVAGIYLIDKGRHAVITPLKKAGDA